MLAAKHRIPAKEIPGIVRRGKKLHSPLFTLILWHDTATDFPHFAFIVSKKVAASAVKRNRIKRRLRAIAFQLLKSEKLRADTSYIFLVKSQAVAEVPAAELREMVTDLVNR